ncbi:hypothetical protein L9F63_027177 [Diploptera punctata]|uniref:CHK kinase-like domain-containing protein n=1 Tax=Diploptera punctata TaxID=6984 RepID=A0AAD8ENL6_DIPPU|nr:hypothetical protein L9F63_027177 [Diploptera punctata]
MNKMLEECHHLAPECYYASVEPPTPAIVLEDLTEKSFKVPELLRKLDMKHCQLVMNKLAVFHAASAVFISKYPQQLQNFKSSIYVDINLGSPRANFPPLIRKLVETIVKLPEYKERFYEKLSRFAEEVVDVFLEGVALDEDEFNVLAHEDLWINNIMFQYKGDCEEPIDVRFIDYQMCSWGSPGIDIQRFVLCLGSQDVLQQYDNLVEEYYRVLRDTLHNLGCLYLCPTRDVLDAQVDRRAKFGVLHGIICRIDLSEDQRVLTEESREDIIAFLNFIENRKWF